MDEVESVSLVLAVLVMAGVEFTKRAGLPSRWAPLAALGWAGLFAVLGRLAALGGLAGQSWPAVALVALLSAFTAAGVYSGAKAVARG